MDRALAAIGTACRMPRLPPVRDKFTDWLHRRVRGGVAGVDEVEAAEAAGGRHVQ